MKSALNAELSSVFGADYDWLQVITSVVNRRVNSGLVDDVLTDVTGDIILEGKDKTGALATSIIRIKDGSKSEAELLQNLQRTVRAVAYYRTSMVVRHRYQHNAIQFSQFDTDSKGQFSDTIQSRFESEELESEKYAKLLMDELELMATAEEWKNRPNSAALAKRYRLAKEMVPDRIAGKTLKYLMPTYGITSKSQFHVVLNDIQTALSRVAKRIGNVRLMQGTAGVEV